MKCRGLVIYLSVSRAFPVGSWQRAHCNKLWNIPQWEPVAPLMSTESSCPWEQAPCSLITRHGLRSLINENTTCFPRFEDVLSGQKQWLKSLRKGDSFQGAPFEHINQSGHCLCAPNLSGSDLLATKQSAFREQQLPFSVGFTSQKSWKLSGFHHQPSWHYNCCVHREMKVPVKWTTFSKHTEAPLKSKLINSFVV